MKADDATVPARALLADLLMGRHAALEGIADLAPGQLLECANEHGVAALASQRLDALLKDRAPLAIGSHLTDRELATLGDLALVLEGAARDEALTSMLLESEARRVIGVMARSGTPCLLLKGSALAYWAYAQPHLRRCSDVDVLVPSRPAAEGLAEGLRPAGYVRSAIVSEPVAYELMCWRTLPTGWRMEIDIHWRLNNSALFAERLGFDELMAHSVALPRLGDHARVLCPAHALIHACTHRALNLATGWDDHLKWLYDLIVLMDHLTPLDWQQLVDQARSKQLAGVVLNGLEVASATFQYPLPVQAAVGLRQAADNEPLDRARLADWRYMQWHTFLALRGHRMRWIWQRVFPTRDRLASIYGEQPHYSALLWLRFKRAIGRLIRA